MRRRIAVEPDHEAAAQGTCLRQVADVPAMQDVEHAVGEHHRLRQGSDSRFDLIARAQLVGVVAHEAAATLRRVAQAGKAAAD